MPSSYFYMNKKKGTSTSLPEKRTFPLKRAKGGRRAVAHVTVVSYLAPLSLDKLLT